jgi:iron complex outermembrane receptor protein
MSNATRIPTGCAPILNWQAIPKENFDWKLNLGMEWQQTNSLISNYDNNAGEKGNVQRIDKINTGQHFFFARYAADIYKRLHVEAALSLNYYHYKFRNTAPLNEADFTGSFDAATDAEVCAILPGYQ